MSVPRRILTFLLPFALFPATLRAEAVASNPVTARVVFYARSTGHDFEGVSTQVRGHFGCDRARIVETARAEIAIPVRSLRTGIAGRDKTMYESLDSDRNPEIRFRLRRLTSFRTDGAETFAASAEGDLSIRGETRPIVIPVTGRFVGTDLEVAGAVPIRMTEFGITPPGFLFFRVEPVVRVAFVVRARIEAAR